MSSHQNISTRKILGLPLTPKQDAIVNYLVPSLGASILYILLFSVEVGLIHRHYLNWHRTLTWTTLSIMYFPVLASYVIVLSRAELWPERTFGGKKNLFWLWYKTVQHIFFPVWSLWR